MKSEKQARTQTGAQIASGIRLGLTNIAATVDATMVQVTNGAGNRPRNIGKELFKFLI